MNLSRELILEKIKHLAHCQKERLHVDEPVNIALLAIHLNAPLPLVYQHLTPLIIEKVISLHNTDTYSAVRVI